MLPLREINWGPIPDSAAAAFPFSLPLIRARAPIAFEAPVTFLVGENGSGKSTWLEALAIAAGSIVVGSAPLAQDPTLDAVRRLARTARLTWNRRTKRGFFLRAEDFFGYAKREAQARAEMEQAVRDADAEYADRSAYARGLAKMPYARELADMRRRHGDGVDTQSHGESFLTLFRGRFVPGGLYLLDEPEAPLSPMRQLTLLALLAEMVAADAQFVIATHSPILMAFPGARILSFDTIPPTPVAYDDLEHVVLTRDFLNNPQAYLRHLLGEG